MLVKIPAAVFHVTSPAQYSHVCNIVHCYAGEGAMNPSGSQKPAKVVYPAAGKHCLAAKQNLQALVRVTQKH